MRFVLLAAFASLFVTASAAAQTCKGNDALSSARRARRSLEDVAATNADVDGDLDRLSEAQALWPGAPPRARAYVSAVGDLDYFTTFPTCTSAGLRPGSLLQMRGGLVAGYDRRAIGLRLHYIASSDQLLVSDPHGPAFDEAIKREHARNPTAPEPRGSSAARLAFDQRVIGGSLTLSRWARVELEQVTTFAPSSRASYPSGIAVSDSSPSMTGEQRLVGAFSVPALHLSSQALTGADEGVIDFATVGSTRLPIVRTGLLATISSSYIADERQVTTLAGLTYQGWYRRRGRPPLVRTSDSVIREGSGYELTTEASAEYGSGRLRHTRLRAETFAVGSRAHRPAVWQGATYLRASAFAEATSFGSAHFTEQTGKENVLGGGGGVHGAFGIRAVSMHAELYGGANRPEAVARVSELATRGEFKGQLYVRSGW